MDALQLIGLFLERVRVRSDGGEAKRASLYSATFCVNDVFSVPSWIPLDWLHLRSKIYGLLVRKNYIMTVSGQLCFNTCVVVR